MNSVIFTRLLDASGEAHPMRIRQLSRKRQISETSPVDLPPLKRARLESAASEHPWLEGERIRDTEIIQHPQPIPRKAAFLENVVDPSCSNPCLGRDCPDSVDKVTSWLVDTLSVSESYRERYSRSDSFLGPSDDNPVPRRLTRSAAPIMEPTRDADGFAVPPKPQSEVGSASVYAESVSQTEVSGSVSGSGLSSGKNLVEGPLYREMNLAANNIYIRPLHEQLPKNITDLVDHVRKDRGSPGPSLDEVRQDSELNDLWMGAGEPQVEEYFRDAIFPSPRLSDSLGRADRCQMARQIVPNTGSKLRISNPVPDMLFGYKRLKAFPQQQAQLVSIGTSMVANSQGLLYPFLVVEFKGDGPSGSGSMWVATNQCLGGSASCVNIAESLNHQLRQCKNIEARPISSAAFSIAMSGTEARLYISWKHNKSDYYMASVENFLLHKPADYLEFRKYVRNIIDWGKDARLKEIRDSLDNLLEESRKRASELAKSRPPPSSGSTTSGGKGGRSSSRGRSSGTRGG